MHEILATQGLFLGIAAPFLAALAAPLLHKPGTARAAFLLALLPLSLFLGFTGLIPDIAAGASHKIGIDWLPRIGVRLSFLIDGLSLFFALLITGIGTLIVLFSGGYMKEHPQAGRFLSFLFLFMGAMLGLVLADDGITLFVFWEGTSLTSFLLIGFDHKRERARRAALQALVVTGAGGLCLLAGVLLAGNITGTHALSELITKGEVIRQSAAYLPLLLLFLAAAFTKSAQAPFHIWLPNAMEAPTPVSAYLHSATMVKAGIYLLLRLNPAFGETAAWTTLLALFGGVTLVMAALFALTERDMKQMLAQTTVASLGLLTLLIGIGGPAALAGAIAYLFAHSLFKGALFMVAGTVEHEAGTRHIERLGGLRRALPVTFLAAFLAACSMAGLPGLIGFPAKEALYHGLDVKAAHAALLAAFIGNAIMLVIGFRIALKPFLGALKSGLAVPSHEPFLLIVGPLLLGLCGLVAGLIPYALGSWLIDPALSVVHGATAQAGLHLIPEKIGTPLLLSLATFALGVILYHLHPRGASHTDPFIARFARGMDNAFDHALKGLLFLAVRMMRLFQHGNLQGYLTLTALLLALGLLIPLLAAGEAPALPPMPVLSFAEWSIVLLNGLGALAVLFARSRLTAILSLGVQGFATAVIFMLFGAPDLSFTQFMIETLAVIILVLAVTRFALGGDDRRTLGARILGGGIALGVGAGFALALLATLQGPFDRRLTDFYDHTAYLLAHGRNVVNVIIVDFRGLDTLGEIAVVMLAGIAILALLRLRGRLPILSASKK